MTFCNPACHPLSDSQRLLPWNSVGPGLCSCRKKHPAACLLVVLLNHLGLPFESLQPQRKFRGKSLKVSHLGFHVSWGRFHVSWGRPRPMKLLEQKNMVPRNTRLFSLASKVCASGASANSMPLETRRSKAHLMQGWLHWGRNFNLHWVKEKPNRKPRTT